MLLDAIPVPSVIVLIGAAGAGKTAIATAFPGPWRLSLDDCRHRVADDAGDQSSTPDAVAVFDAVFAGRMARRLPTLVDATNVDPAVRAELIQRAHSRGLPAVAIVTRTDLATCLARQETRPANRTVPPQIITAQHQAVPTTGQLLREGFDQVHDATDLDLMRLLLERSAAASFDPLTDVRATFGPELARVFTFDPDSTDSRGCFAVAGRQITVRWSDDGEPFDHHWQARVDGVCKDCGSAQWVKVTCARDLLDVYTGGFPDEPVCEHCHVPDWCRT